MWEIIGGAGIMGFLSLMVFIVTKSQSKKIECVEAKIDTCITKDLCEERSGNIQAAIERIETNQDRDFEKVFNKLDALKGR